MKGFFSSVNEHFPEVKKTWAIAKDELEKGSDPTYVQKLIIEDLTEVKYVLSPRGLRKWQKPSKPEQSIEALIKRFKTLPETYLVRKEL